MPVPVVGTQLGSYRLEALLGRGGMGVVYRALDVRLGRHVALKLLAGHLAQDARFRTRFLTESRLAASIDHAGIVPVYEAGEIDGHLFIAMRYVRGTDLASLLRENGPLAPERAVALVAQLAEALDAAHAHGLLHRDVKPSNALVAMEGSTERVYLADFGLTKHISTAGGATDSDQLVGTIDYVAPERIRGERADGRADLYSLGCVLFECLTGEVPFARESEVATIYAHLEEDAPRPSQRRPGLPAGLDAVLERALAKDPEQRFSSGAQLAEAARAAITAAAPSAVRRAARRPPRAALLALALVIAVLSAAGILIAHRSGGSTLALADADAVAVIDPGRGSLIGEVPVGSSPSQIAVGAGAVWIANADNGTVSRVDERTRMVSTISVGSGPVAVAVGAGGVWVVNSLDGTLSWISPATNRVVKTKPIGNGPSGVCVTAGGVWVADSYDRRITRFDPISRRITITHLDDPPTQLACGGGSVWASSQTSGTVTRLAASGRGDVVGQIAVGSGPSGLAWEDGALWVANTSDGTVSRIDGRSGVRSAVIRLGNDAGPANVAVGAGGVWVSNERAGTVARIDPARGVVVKTLRTGKRPEGLAVVDGSLWVGVRAIGAQHRGGTLRILDPTVSPHSRLKAAALDPANAYNGWDVLPLTNDGLVAFRRVGGQQGADLVPDLAASLPQITDGGRSYGFRLRPGIRYSTGAAVRASDIRHGIERVLRRRSLPVFYTGIRGARRCVARPARCELSSGIRVDDAAGTITFRLTAADPDFLYKLALPGAVAVPRAIGFGPLRRPLPATGPYLVARVRPPAVVQLVRNPHFEAVDGRPDGYPDAISIDEGAQFRGAIPAIQRGRADLIGADLGLPSELRPSLDTIATRYAGQLHTTVRPALAFAFLNTRMAPFNNINVRRAMNYAVNRRAFVALKGGERFAQPTCQILPSNFPGYRPYCPYTAGTGTGRPWSAPNLARARRLVSRSHTRGMRVTVIGWTYLGHEARLLERLLQRLGYRATLRQVPNNADYFAYVADSRHRVQIGAMQWIADYPGAAGYLQALFSCAAFVPGDPNQSNYSQFCDPYADRLMQRARRLPADDPRADALWAKADRRIVDQAAAIPLTNPDAFAFVSRRVGNYQYSSQSRVMYDQLWVR